MPAGTRADVLVLFAEEAVRPNGAVAEVNQALAGQLIRAATEEGFHGKADQTFVLHTHGKLPVSRVVLVGTGPRERTDAEVLRQAAGRGVKAAQRLRARSVAMAVPGDPGESLGPVAEGAALGAYRFDQYRTEGREERVPLEAVRLLLPDGAARSRALEEVLERVLRVTEAANFARTLVNEPAGHLTPETLAEEASRVAKGRGLDVRVSGPQRAEEAEDGDVLRAWARAAQNTPRLIEIAYRPKKAAEAKAPAGGAGGQGDHLRLGRPVAEARGGHGGHEDGHGRARRRCWARMQVVAAAGAALPRARATSARARTCPRGTAYRPGDILISRLGKTVEITNTDAEGRLVLGDILAWACEHKPGGPHRPGHADRRLRGRAGQLHRRDLRRRRRAGGGACSPRRGEPGEEIWRMPVADLQKDALRSDVADMKNSGERWGGAINAAIFLREFVGERALGAPGHRRPGAGSPERGYQGKGATGIGVRTLGAFLEARARGGR